jgi:hypothetical protein
MPITQGVYTIGGGDANYPGIAGLDDFFSAIGGLSGDLEGVVTGDVNWTTTVEKNWGGHTFTLRNAIDHRGNFNVGPVITISGVGGVIHTSSANAGNHAILDGLHFADNKIAVSSLSNGGAFNYLKVTIRNCLFEDCDVWFVLWAPAYFYNNKLYDSWCNIYTNKDVEAIFENNSVYHSPAINSAAFVIRPWSLPSADYYYAVFRNNAAYVRGLSAFDYTEGMGSHPWGFNNYTSTVVWSMWHTGSTGNVGGIDSNVFSSIAILDIDFLDIDRESFLYGVGDTNIGVFNTEDIAGNPRPNNLGLVSVGAYEPLTSEFPNMIIDSGAVYKNYGLDDEILIGATRGGNKFGIDTKIEDLGYDGRGNNVQGAKRITSVQPYIEANVIEVSGDLIQMALPASAVSAGATHDTVIRTLQLALSDYCDNITIVGEVWGKNYPVVCIVKNALCISDFELSNADKSEAVIALRFIGHFDPDDLDAEPWEIRYPRE